MNFRKSLVCALTASALMFAGVSFAQEAPVPTPPAPPAAPMPPGPPMPPSPPASPTMPGSTGSAASYQTPQGELTVRSSPAPAPIVGPAPPFEQLSAGGRAITEEQAAAYPPLANDFLNADRNRNGSISAGEYQQWQKH